MVKQTIFGQIIVDVLGVAQKRNYEVVIRFGEGVVGSLNQNRVVLGVVKGIVTGLDLNLGRIMIREGENIYAGKIKDVVQISMGPEQGERLLGLLPFGLKQHIRDITRRAVEEDVFDEIEESLDTLMSG